MRRIEMELLQIIKASGVVFLKTTLCSGLQLLTIGRVFITRAWATFGLLAVNVEVWQHVAMTRMDPFKLFRIRRKRCSVSFVMPSENIISTVILEIDQ
jgi:type IV secretory pathway TrbD component